MALQFPVRNCWSSKFGLLVERLVKEEVEDLDSNKSVLFSLLHPLDDFTRVVMKQSSRICEFQVRPGGARAALTVLCRVRSSSSPVGSPVWP